MSRIEVAPLIAAAFQKIIGLAVLPLGKRSQTYAKALLAESVAPEWETKGIIFFCPGSWPYSRSDMGKEPGTYRWIDSFAQGDVLWDIGANVGVYSLYAAKRGHSVCAFEPEASNFYLLAKNLERNGFTDRMVALNFALSDITGLVSFAIGDGRIGGAQHQINNKNIGRRIVCFSCRDAAQTFSLPIPNHIKIDVDGAELSVMRGIDLANNHLRSVLVETHQGPDGDAVYGLMAEHGFVPDRPRENTQRSRNVIFRR